MDAIVSSEGLPPLVPAIESNQFDVSLGLWVVATTRFLSIAPELAARRLERLRLVRVVSTSPSLGASPLMLQYHQHQRAYPAFETFVSAARMAARGLRGKPPQ
jgi:DNA-binding transcriptional LysR family regulator